MDQMTGGGNAGQAREPVPAYGVSFGPGDRHMYSDVEPGSGRSPAAARRRAPWVLRSLVSIVFALQASCATNGGVPTALPTSVDSLGRVGLVTGRGEPTYEFDAFLESKPEGAAAGAFMGVGKCFEGALGGSDLSGLSVAFMMICLPIAALVGAVAGASVAAPADTIDAARAKAQDEFASMQLNQVALREGLDYAHAVGLQLQPLDRGAGPAGPGDNPDYAGLSDQVDTVIEIDILRVHASTSGTQGVPMAFTINARTRVVDTHGARVLDSHDGIYTTPERVAGEWLADGGRALSDALQAGVRDIVVQALGAIQDEIMIYRPSGPTKVGYFDGHVPGYALRSNDPPIRVRPKLTGGLFTPKNYCDSGEATYGGLERYRLDSIQPTFRWEPLPRDFDLTPGSGPGQAQDLRYDIRIFGAGDTSYERNGLPQPSHTVEVPLAPCSEFRWTVRARFMLDGASRVTEWTGAYNTIGGYADPAWIRRHPGKPALAAIPSSPLPFFPIVLTPSADGGSCTCK